MKAILGIGTNIGDKLENIKNACSAIDLLPDTVILRKSAIYETQPWGYTQQDNFYNCVVEIETSLSPNALLGACLGIEAGLGRVRQFKNGPRIIDIDVLLIDGITVGTEELTVPHKFIKQRDFVIVPLNDLFPENVAFGYDFSKEYASTDKSKLNKIKQ